MIEIKRCVYPKCEKCPEDDCVLRDADLMRKIGSQQELKEKATSCVECGCAYKTVRSGIEYLYCDYENKLIDLCYTGKACYIPPKEKKKRKRFVVQIDPLTNKIVKVHDSITTAYEYIGRKKGAGISEACNGRQKIAHGFIWRYVEVEV